MEQNIYIHIGIDPDLQKSGVAIWDSRRKDYDSIECLGFWELIEMIESWNIPIIVHIEAGWLNKKSNFHQISPKFNAKIQKKIGENIAKKVGQNHAVGQLLEQYCIAHEIPYRLVKPIGKKHNDTKLKFKNITGSNLGTNQEKRDAGLLVYGK